MELHDELMKLESHHVLLLYIKVIVLAAEIGDPSAEPYLAIGALRRGKNGRWEFNKEKFLDQVIIEMEKVRQANGAT